MPRDSSRFERFRPVKRTESTDVFPAIKDVVEDDRADTGETADADAGVVEQNPPEPDTVGTDRPAQLREHAVRIGEYLWRRLVSLTASLVAWVVQKTRVGVPQAGSWLRPRLIRLGATIVAGLLLCSSYPRFNWWWAAIVAFGVMAWVLTRPATTLIGGFGYGFLFGLACYLPLIRWISILVGAVPLLALV